MKPLFAVCFALLVLGCNTPNANTEAIKNTADTIVKEKDTPHNKVELKKVKYEGKVGFADFKVKTIYTGPKANLNYKSHKLARRFKTVITEVYNSNNEVDFAGYYIIARWGCGSNCQQTALIDMRDGKVYEGLMSENNFDIKPNSRLYMVNPPDSAGYYIEECLWCTPKPFIWDEGQKAFFELKPNGDKVKHSSSID